MRTETPEEPASVACRITRSCDANELGLGGDVGEHSKIARLCDIARVVLAAIVGASSYPNKRGKSMSTQTKPSIVFAHGIWADGSCFNRVIPPLQADGYEVASAQ